MAGQKGDPVMVDERRFTPFADGETSLELHGLTFENGTDALAVYGNGVFTRDAAGRAALAAVVDVLRRAVAALDEAGPAAQALPDGDGRGDGATSVANPFG